MLRNKHILRALSRAWLHYSVLRAGNIQWEMSFLETLFSERQTNPAVIIKFILPRLHHILRNFFYLQEIILRS